MSDTANTRPPSSETYVDAALRRIKREPTPEAQQVQASRELVVILCSIRRILTWTLVVVPIILIVLVVILGVASQPPS